MDPSKYPPQDKLVIHGRSPMKLAFGIYGEENQTGLVYRNLDNYHNAGKNWRAMISNFDPTPFQFNGFTYLTIEHAVHAFKYGSKTDVSYRFSMESGSELSKGTGFDAIMQNQLVELSPELLDDWKYMQDQVLFDVIEAKFRQHLELKDILLSTRCAGIFLYSNKKGYEQSKRMYILEMVRDKFRSEII